MAAGDQDADLNRSQQRGPSVRSQVRRSELIATGRKLFSDTSYDALSMDDIAKHAGVAKGLIYYYFKNKRGYYLAIIEDSVGELVSLAAGGAELPRTQRVQRTVEAYLRFAKDNEAAYRTIITGGVGFDTQVQAIRLPRYAQPPVRYQICQVVRSGVDTAGAGAFIAKVRSSRGRGLLKAAGFGLPPTK